MRDFLIHIDLVEYNQGLFVENSVGSITRLKSFTGDSYPAAGTMLWLDAYEGCSKCVKVIQTIVRPLGFHHSISHTTEVVVFAEKSDPMATPTFTLKPVQKSADDQ